MILHRDCSCKATTHLYTSTARSEISRRKTRPASSAAWLIGSAVKRWACARNWRWLALAGGETALGRWLKWRWSALVGVGWRWLAVKWRWLAVKMALTGGQNGVGRRLKWRAYLGAHVFEHQVQVDRLLLAAGESVILLTLSLRAY